MSEYRIRPRRIGKTAEEHAKAKIVKESAIIRAITKTHESIMRPRPASFTTRRLIDACLCVALILAIPACETRRVSVIRPDGTELTYDRTTLFGDSTTEGVTVAKTGDDWAVGVGASGSTSNAEEMMGLMLDLARAGARAGGVPAP